MKANQIFVGINGAKIGLQNGNNAVAVFPGRKGENASYWLKEDGQVTVMKGSRINGVGVARFLRDKGFELAQPGDEHAARLADLLDIEDGVLLVSNASTEKSAELQRDFAAQYCTFVPFDGSKAVAVVKVAQPEGFRTYGLDLLGGFVSGNVRIEHVFGGKLGFEVALSAGWLVGPDGDAENMPHNSGYGGEVERAVFIICNCGLGTLVGAPNLVPVENGAVDAPYLKGQLEFALRNTDTVLVGITAGDVLEVTYRRNGEALYSRAGLAGVALREVIGSIAAVLVRVAELDAAPVKKASKKAA